MLRNSLIMQSNVLSLILAGVALASCVTVALAGKSHQINSINCELTKLTATALEARLDVITSSNVRFREAFFGAISR